MSGSRGFKKPSKIVRFDEAEPQYPIDVYIAYSRSICNELERRVVEHPPACPAEFWELVESAQGRAKARMQRLTRKPSETP